MGSSDNPNWFLDCSLIDDIPDSAGDFAANNGGIYWTPQGLDPSSNVSVDIDSSFVNSDGLKESGSAKRARSESCSRPASKACREKMRRERLNDRFLELSSLLDPGNPPKTDKAAILIDAARLVTQLRHETQKLKDSNESLQEKIKELKAEKNELRDEKQRLKAEKESMEQQVKLLNARPSYVPQPPLVSSPFAAQGQAAGHKLMVPIIGFPGFPMWQYMPPSDVDTSQDADNCPPVA
ncbi:transcription factor ILR3-like [Canna indica]|uniref:Transcription factor ILR3-like n=1 Tax=Canna indica TaxID=4628 RepID=A0AAQ3Q8R9_9LILI|nr:transcription factor ILR3-like [Canna indica]